MANELLDDKQQPNNILKQFGTFQLTRPKAFEMILSVQLMQVQTPIRARNHFLSEPYYRPSLKHKSKITKVSESELQKSKFEKGLYRLN